VLLGLLPRIEQFVREYAEDRKRRGKADFDDLLFWARDLLRDSEPARRYFRARYRTVPIDEFQDTDPVQAELALLLTSDQDPGEDWGDLRPGPARLTVVGDPKQSIYRFCRADIAVYDQVKTCALAGSTEQIVTNFRSNEPLLPVLNPAFNAIFTAAPGVQPANVELQPPPEAPRAGRPPVLIAEGSVVDDADGVRREEAPVDRRAPVRRARAAMGDPRPPRQRLVAAVPLGRYGDPDARPHRDRALRAGIGRGRDSVPPRRLARLFPARRGPRPDLGAVRRR
jgi:ATP-dependent helicase/nuclease subunit A